MYLLRGAMKLTKEAKIVLWFLGVTALVSTCSIGISIGYQMSRRNQGPRPTSGRYEKRTQDRDIEAKDLTKVDIVELEPQALALAQELVPDAKLVRIEAHDLTGGTFDATHPSRVYFSFGDRKVDSSLPAGKDVIRTGVDVTVVVDHLHAELMDGAQAGMPPYKIDNGAGSPPQSCSTRKLWRKAVKSGVPEDAFASFFFDAADHMKWRLRVTDHDDYDRDFDGVECRQL